MENELYFGYWDKFKILRYTKHTMVGKDLVTLSEQWKLISYVCYPKFNWTVKNSAN